MKKTFMRLIVFCCAFLLGSQLVIAKDGQIDFIENKGQWGHGIRYQAEIPGGTFFMTDKGFVYNFVNTDDLAKYNHDCESEKGGGNDKIGFHAYKLNFIGANMSNAITHQGFDKRSNYNNYFIGNDATKWKGHVGLYGKIKLGNIYNGIDVYVYNNIGETGKENSLKYDFVVGAGVNANQVKLAFEGVSPNIDEDGNLVIQTTVNKIVEQAPYCYQEVNGRKVTVASRYALNNGVLSFVFPDGYNQSYPLVIDPQLVFATYSGATSSNVYAMSTTYDQAGNLYAGADVWDAGWPVTTGAFQTTFADGGHDIGINKYNDDGSALIYSTYYGGSGWDYSNAMRVNNLNELVVVGGTASSDLPISATAFQNTISGGSDIFVAKFSSDGSSLVGATYLGGSGSDLQYITISDNPGVTQISSNGHGAVPPVDLDFDVDGNIWVVGNTNSSDFPVTANAQQSTKSGSIDGFVDELNDDCSQLLYGSFIGGSGNDFVSSILFNDAGNVVVCGSTTSSDFPTTSGAYHTTAPGGAYDGFVSILDPNNGTILNSTYVGTDKTDEGMFLQKDCADNIYILGSTSGNYPITPGAWSTNTNGDVFVDKLNSDLSGSVISTRLGTAQSSSGTYYPTSFLVDICGRTYLAGYNESYSTKNLPVTPDAFSDDATSSFWFCALEPSFSDIQYGTFFGVSGDHNHVGINRMDPQGIVYQSICNYNQYPFTGNHVWSPSKQTSGQDVVSFKFSFDIATVHLKELTGGGGNETTPHAVRGCKSAYFDFVRNAPDTFPLTIHYQLTGTATNAGSNPDYQVVSTDSIVIPAYDTMARLEVKPLIVPGMPTGDRTVHIDVFSPCGCQGGGNNIIASGDITIVDSLYVNIPQSSQTVCANTPVTITANIDPELNYSWSPENLIPDPHPFGLTIHPVPVHPTVYTITATQPGAPATCPPHSVSYFANVEQYPQVIMPAKDTTVCINPGDSVQLTTFAIPEGVNYSYQWTPATNLRDDHSRVNKFAGPPNDYHYTLVATSPLAHCSGQNEMTIHVVPPFHFTSVTPADTIIDYGEKVQMDAEGNAIAWVWLPVDYLDEPTLQKPTAQPTKSMQYTVMGMDKYGCRDTGVVNIEVKYQPNFFIPTAFTPNGDGKNDVFRIENVQFEKLLTFKVYNRLGQLVFNTKNVINGWDGTFNGKPSAADTYFYVIEVVLPDGTHQAFKGDITLVR